MNDRGDFGTPPSSYGATRVSYQQYNDNDNFNTLCDNASGKIFLINKNVSKLEQLSKSIDFSENEKDLESKVHTLFQETNKLATAIKNIFKETLEYTRPGRFESHDNRHRQYNLLQNKLRKEFENSLSRYHAIQNVLTLDMKASIEQEVSFSHHQDSSMDTAVKDTQQEQLIEHDQLNEQVQMEVDLAEAKEREARLMQIEEDVLNVNEIFRDLAFLVHEQGQVVDSIESNIEHASVQVGEAKKQLLRAKNYQRSYRKKICIITLIVTVVVIVLALIIYFGVKD